MQIDLATGQPLPDQHDGPASPCPWMLARGETALPGPTAAIMPLATRVVAISLAVEGGTSVASAVFLRPQGRAPPTFPI
jgi:hypothetical protein